MNTERHDLTHPQDEQPSGSDARSLNDDPTGMRLASESEEMEESPDLPAAPAPAGAATAAPDEPDNQATRGQRDRRYRPIWPALR